jgi:hypothetical protein
MRSHRSPSDNHPKNRYSNRGHQREYHARTKKQTNIKILLHGNPLSYRVQTEGIANEKVEQLAANRPPIPQGAIASLLQRLVRIVPSWWWWPGFIRHLRTCCSSRRIDVTLHVGKKSLKHLRLHTLFRRHGRADDYKGHCCDPQKQQSYPAKQYPYSRHRVLFIHFRHCRFL